MSNPFRLDSRSLSLAAAVTVLSLSAGYFTLAWTEPSGTMPVTVDAPINTGSAAQTKTGSLIIGSGLTVTSTGQSFALIGNQSPYAGIINFVVGQDGHVGIGTASPGYSLDIDKKTAGTPTAPMLRLQNSAGTNTPEVDFFLDQAAANMFQIMGRSGVGNLRKDIISADLNSGNVGIGTAGPTDLLNLSTSASKSINLREGTYTYLGSDYSAWTTILGQNVRARRGATSSMELGSGYLGSGASAIRLNWSNIEFHAASALDIASLGEGSAFNSPKLTIQADGKVVVNNGGQFCIGSSCASSSTWATIVSGAGSGGGGGGYWTQSGSNLYTNSGTSTWNVGIGTNTPSSLLEVNGTAKALSGDELGWRDFAQSFTWDGSAVHYYWNRVFKLRDSTSNVTFQVLLKSDRNYANYGHYSLQASKYDNGSVSAEVDTIAGTGGIPVYLTIDSDGYVWIKGYVVWSSFAGYKVIQQSGADVLAGSDILTQEADPNPNWYVVPAQYIRSTFPGLVVDETNSGIASGGLNGYNECKPVCGGNSVSCDAGWSRVKFVMDGTSCGSSGSLGTVSGPWTWGVAQSRWMSPRSGTPPVYLQDYDYEYFCTPGSGYTNVYYDAASNVSGWYPKWTGTCARTVCRGYSGYAPDVFVNQASSCAICCR
jgi:hypothetical protein